MINPGEFNKKITLQKQEIAPDARGQQIETFVDHMQPWANVKTTRSSEAIQAGNLTSLKETRFILRYSKQLDEILNSNDTRFRIIFKGAVYDVKSAINDDESNVTVTIVGERVDSNGYNTGSIKK